MPVTTTTRSAGPFVGNGVVTALPFGFKVFAPTDLLVTRTVTATGVTTNALLGQDYTVTLTDSGGTVTLVAPLPTGQTAMIESQVPFTQPTLFTATWVPSALNDAVDRAVVLTQQLNLTADRGLRLPITEPAGAELPPAATRANRFLAFNASGAPIVAAGTSASLGPVSAFINTLLDDVDATQARATLGAAAAATGPTNWGGTAGGAANALTLTPATGIPSYQPGQEFVFFAGAAANTGAATITISGLAPIAIRVAGAALQGGEIAANGLHRVTVDSPTTCHLESFVTAGVPSGTILDFAGGVAPSGYLLCDGAAYSRTGATARLFAAIGTVWGAGNGTTTFNVPDFRRRVAVGSGGTAIAGPGAAVGNVGGTETHVLAVAEMPWHGHGVSDPGHSHTAVTAGAIGLTFGISQNNGSAGALGTSHVGTGVSIHGAGGGAAHNNMQPSAVVLKIIKT